MHCMKFGYFCMTQDLWLSSNMSVDRSVSHLASASPPSCWCWPWPPPICSWSPQTPAQPGSASWWVRGNPANHQQHAHSNRKTSFTSKPVFTSFVFWLSAHSIIHHRSHPSFLLTPAFCSDRTQSCRSTHLNKLVGLLPVQSVGHAEGVRSARLVELAQQLTEAGVDFTLTVLGLQTLRTKTEVELERDAPAVHESEWKLNISTLAAENINTSTNKKLTMTMLREYFGTFYTNFTVPRGKFPQRPFTTHKTKTHLSLLYIVMFTKFGFIHIMWVCYQSNKQVKRKQLYLICSIVLMGFWQVVMVLSVSV